MARRARRPPRRAGDRTPHRRRPSAVPRLAALDLALVVPEDEDDVVHDEQVRDVLDRVGSRGCVRYAERLDPDPRRPLLRARTATDDGGRSRRLPGRSRLQRLLHGAPPGSAPERPEQHPAWLRRPSHLARTANAPRGDDTAMAQFLSDQWMDEVQRIKATHEGDPIDQDGLVVNVTVTGVPFGTGTIEVHSDHGPVIGFSPGPRRRRRLRDHPRLRHRPRAGHGPHPQRARAGDQRRPDHASPVTARPSATGGALGSGTPTPCCSTTRSTTSRPERAAPRARPAPTRTLRRTAR